MALVGARRPQRVPPAGAGAVIHTEHLIIGAGVVGCAVGWELARRGREVLVVEAAAVAAGASGGPGLRGVRANGRDPRELPLARRANELWPELADRLGAPTGYVRTGHLQLSERADDRAELEVIVDQQRAAGLGCELVGHDRLRELEPELSPAVVSAVHCLGDGVADHTATTTAFASALQDAGGQLREGVRVTELRQDDRGRCAVTDDGEVVTWSVGAVLAVNGAAADLVAPLGVTVPVFAVHPQVLVTAPVVPAPVRHLIGHAQRRLAVKMLPDSTVMITGGWLGRTDPVTGDGVVEPNRVAGNLADAAAVFPVLEGVRLVDAEASRAEGIAADMIPIVDRLPVPDATWIATGWSGHGWAIAPAVAEQLAEWMITGQRPADLAPFGLGRF